MIRTRSLVLFTAFSLAITQAAAAQPTALASQLDAHITSRRDAHAQALAEIAAIRSPSGQEHDRARWVADRMRTIGLADVSVDTMPNAIGRLRGSLPDGQRRAVVFVSTLDDLATVAAHQASAPRPPYVDGDRVIGPGSNTSSTTIAMLAAAEALIAAGVRPEHDLIFAAVAQEETGLLGMKALYADWRSRADGFVDVLGDGRSITYGALGIHWWRVWAYHTGGHSLSGGLPNVNQGIARAVDRILSLPQPAANTRTVMNVSMLQSGDVFNRKPDSAWFSLDIRSLHADQIARNEAAVREILAQVSAETGTRFDMRAVQLTGGGQIPGADTSRLVRSSVAIARDLGLTPTLGNAGSANLNVAIAGGTLAIGLGGERGGARGEPGEFADLSAMQRTARHVARLAAVMGSRPAGGR
jgi:acetylornithine deacetylase/succinyl-diaminopimelate desuccinylase-like protein